MLKLPEKIGQKDHERNGHAAGKPAVTEQAARGAEEQAAEQREGQKKDGVFGFQPHADGRADPQPPARILVRRRRMVKSATSAHHK